MSSIIVIPAMNEEKTISKVISDIRAHNKIDIVVVDDGSSDDTKLNAEKAGAIVLSHTLNLGAWKATQTGFRYALQKGYSKVITMDADGQHKARDIEYMLQASAKGNDLVIGSCIKRGSKGRLITWRALRWLSRIPVNDLTSGFRVYGRAALVALSGKRATMLEYQDLGVLFLIKHCGLSCTEIPVTMSEREEGISRIFYSWSAVISYLVYTFILTVSKMVPFLSRSYSEKIQKESSID